MRDYSAFLRRVSGVRCWLLRDIICSTFPIAQAESQDDRTISNGVSRLKGSKEASEQTV